MLQRKSCLQQKMSQLDHGIYQGLADCKHAHVGTSIECRDPGYKADSTVCSHRNSQYSSFRPCSPDLSTSSSCLQAHFKHNMHRKEQVAIAFKDWQSTTDRLHSPVVGNSTIAESWRCSAQG